MSTPRWEKFNSIMKAGFLSIPIVLLLSFLIIYPFWDMVGVFISVFSVFVGVFTDLIYSYVLGVPDITKGMLDFLEHYHWGCIFTLLSVILHLLPLFGMGVYLIVAECFQSHPFSIGLPNFKETSIMGSAVLSITVLAIILTAL